MIFLIDYSRFRTHIFLQWTLFTSALFVFAVVTSAVVKRADYFSGLTLTFLNRDILLLVKKYAL